MGVRKRASYEPKSNTNQRSPSSSKQQAASHQPNDTVPRCWRWSSRAVRSLGSRVRELSALGQKGRGVMLSSGLRRLLPLGEGTREIVA